MGAVPVPVSDTVCGLVGSESVTCRVAERLPDALGAKVTLMVQFVPALRLDPQVLVSVKSLCCMPVIEMLMLVSDVVPLLVRVTFCTALVKPVCVAGKLRLLGEAPTLLSTMTEMVEVRTTLPLEAMRTTG